MTPRKPKYSQNIFHVPIFLSFSFFLVSHCFPCFFPFLYPLIFHSLGPSFCSFPSLSIPLSSPLSYLIPSLLLLSSSLFFLALFAFLTHLSRSLSFLVFLSFLSSFLSTIVSFPFQMSFHLPALSLFPCHPSFLNCPQHLLVLLSFFPSFLSCSNLEISPIGS